MTLLISGRTEILQRNHWRVVLQDVELLDDTRVVGGSDSRIVGGAYAENARGHYSGQLDSSRHLAGTTVDIDHPFSQATWSATRQF